MFSHVPPRPTSAQMKDLKQELEQAETAIAEARLTFPNDVSFQARLDDFEFRLKHQKLRVESAERYLSILENTKFTN